MTKIKNTVKIDYIVKIIVKNGFMCWCRWKEQHKS